MLAVDFVLGFHEFFGRVQHGGEDHPAKHRSVVDLDVVDEAPGIVVDGAVLLRLEPGQLAGQLGHEFLEHGGDDQGLDALHRAVLGDVKITRVAMTEILSALEFALLLLHFS